MPAIDFPEVIENFPEHFLDPAVDPYSVKIIKGPNIREIPRGTPPDTNLTASVALKLGDNVTTDDILPGGATMLSLRSNVPDSVPYLFRHVDPYFADKLEKLGPRWVVVGGVNYGQGSAREHAVMVPMYAGLVVVIAKSFARIHRQNLINFGVVPLVFQDPVEYESLECEDELRIERFPDQLRNGSILVLNHKKDREIKVLSQCDERETEIILCGGLLSKMQRKYGEMDA